MKIIKELVGILIVSLVCGFSFNAFSSHGINIFDNPWTKKNADKKPDSQFEYNSGVAQEGPIIFVPLAMADKFVKNHEGIVLDSRNPEDYAEGHIPGALFLSFYHITEEYPKIKDQLTESPAILVYCGDIHCEDSEFLANELFNLGHDTILVYKGGFEEWKANKLPVEIGGEENECL